MDTVSDPDIQSHIANIDMKWQFIEELVQWMGGVYEHRISLE